MDLITAKSVVMKLRQGGVMDISEPYFSMMVRDGYIPFHTIPGKKRKLFRYHEAKQALLDSQDPSRDAQREAVKREKQKRSAFKALNEKYLKAFSFNENYSFCDLLKSESINPAELDEETEGDLYDAWNFVHSENSNVLEVIEELSELEKKGGYAGMTAKEVHNLVIRKLVYVLNDGSEFDYMIEEIKKD